MRGIVCLLEQALTGPVRFFLFSSDPLRSPILHDAKFQFRVLDVAYFHLFLFFFLVFFLFFIFQLKLNSQSELLFLGELTVFERMMRLLRYFELNNFLVYINCILVG